MAAATIALVPVLARAWDDRATGRSAVALRPADGAISAWSGLDPQERCLSAAVLVAQANPWPTACRWREPTDGLQGAAFPPPKGEPPFDSPHIEIYVEASQTREEVAHAIAHEMGHMRHTREPAFVPDYLAARSLPPDTPSAVWTEDYAETFAALFSPPVAQWRAPTARPAAEALASLRARFFS